jgi:hypothetical protein
MASSRRPEEHDPNLLPRNRLGRLIDCFIKEDGDNRISTRDRMIGEKDDGLATGRNLDGAAHHTFAGQLLARSGGVALQRLTFQPDSHSVALTGCRPRRRAQGSYVGKPVISRAQHGA